MIQLQNSAVVDCSLASLVFLVTPSKHLNFLRLLALVEMHPHNSCVLAKLVRLANFMKRRGWMYGKR